MKFRSVYPVFASALLALAPCAHSQTAAPSPTPWWKGAVLYEIYPRSFQDSNGDGVGDLNGITSRLDYLQRLGIDGIWISPAYPSPQVDFGYDISNYEAVDPQYGTLADFDKLVAQATEHHVRIVLDMVMNHTSDKHPWFEQSRSSRTNPKRDWYVWRDPKGYTADGKPIPPNNWQSVFGHSAWEWDAPTKQFYYHRFYVQQPDLNWRNPAVEEAMFGVLRFWLDRGVAGFRLDAITALFEDPQMRDDPAAGGVNAYGDPNLTSRYTDNLPEVHGVIERMRQLVASYSGDRVLVGETYLPNFGELDKWYGGAAKNELQLPMDMLLGFGGESGRRLDASHFRTAINDAETGLQGSEPLFVFSNHDNQRDWDRFGDGVHNLAIAKILATMLLTTRDTALLYYGEELGMQTHTPATRDEVQDPIGRLGWPKEKGRDGERTPMQWTAGAQAGFSTDPHTWLPVAADHAAINVETEQQDPNSLLRWYQQLMQLRKHNPAFAPDAQIQVLMDTPGDVLAYLRTGADGEQVLVAMNMGLREQPLDVSKLLSNKGAVATLLKSGDLAPALTSGQVMLPPFSTWIAEPTNAAALDLKGKYPNPGAPH